MTPRSSAMSGSGRRGRGTPRTAPPGALTQRPPRRRLIGRDLQAREAAEVIDAHQVVERQACRTGDPPASSRRFHAVPVVQRVAPQLPGGGEVVGRHARDDRRLRRRRREELLRVGPHLDAVVGHEDRHVADDGDAALAACSQARHWRKNRHWLKRGSGGAPRAARASARAPPSRSRAGSATRQNGRRCLLERHEQRVVLEPARRLRARKASMRTSRFAYGPRLPGPADAFSPTASEGRQPRVVDAGRPRRGPARHLPHLEQASPRRAIRRDNSGLPANAETLAYGESPKARRPERQHLPQAPAPRRASSSTKAIGRGTEIADAGRAGQRGHVQQHATAAPIKQHWSAASPGVARGRAPRSFRLVVRRGRGLRVSWRRKGRRARGRTTTAARRRRRPAPRRRSPTGPGRSLASPGAGSGLEAVHTSPISPSTTPATAFTHCIACIPACPGWQPPAGTWLS